MNTLKKSSLCAVIFSAMAIIGLNLPTLAQIQNYTVYGNDSFTLYRDSLTETQRKARTQERGGTLSLYNSNNELVRPYSRGEYPKFTSEVPMLDMLHIIAIDDIENNNIDNEHFRPGPDFPFQVLYTRDIAFSSYLGTNLMHPEVVKNHLKRCRELRRSVGFICAIDHEIPIEGIENVLVNLNNRDFGKKYETHSYIRRTDDVCWVLGYWEALKVSAEPGELEWMVNEFEYFDRNMYRWFFDESDGLYRGQASFIDAGGNGYPKHFDRQKSVMIKALSTNCLYYKAFKIMAEACQVTGDIKRASAFEDRAEMIKISIRREFLHPDGYYAYFKHEDGLLEERREQLGMAFIVLFDILDEGDFHIAVDDFAGNDYGEPLFWPFYDWNKHMYHNNSIWPFANTLLNMAQLKTHREKHILLRTLGIMSRHALHGNFNEVMDYETGGKAEMHGRHFLWSASAYISVIYRMVLGIDLAMGEVTFNPFVPEELGSFMSLYGLKVSDTTIDLNITGNGKEIKSFKVNGVIQKTNRLKLDGLVHKVEIELE